MRALKSWLARRIQRLLGIEQLHDELQQANHLLRRLSCGISAGNVPDASSGLSSNLPRIGDSTGTCHSLSSRGLFVVGCARSGTTILARCLGCSPEVMLLDEPYFFLHQEIADFARFFNDRHVAMGNRRRKGTYVPPAIRPELGPFGLLQRLCRDYRFVGEKIAFGPHDFPQDWQARYLDFQSAHFQHGRYLLMLRTPAEAIWSMHKMFPEYPIPRLFERWLQTTALTLDAYQVFPNARVVFFDDLGPGLIDKIASWLETPITLTPGTIGTAYIASRLRAGELPEALTSFESLCQRCGQIYDDLRASFSCNDLMYCGAVNRWSFFHDVHQRIDSLLAELSAGAGEPERIAILHRRVSLTDRVKLFGRRSAEPKFAKAPLP